MCLCILLCGYLKQLRCLQKYFLKYMITNLNNTFFYTRNLNYTAYTGMSHRREPVKRPPYPKKSYP
jgi:hypothetical protein